MKAVAPTYPDHLRRDGVAGMVMVKVLINENGDVAERSVSKSTHADFDEPALAAVSRWKFKPAMKAGQPVKALITIPIKFTVD